MKRKNKNDQTGEPQPAYGASNDDTSIHFFSSFDEMEEDNYKWLASLSPEQHLQNATTLIKRIFAEDLKSHPTLGTTISFD